MLVELLFLNCGGSFTLGFGRFLLFFVENGAGEFHGLVDLLLAGPLRLGDFRHLPLHLSTLTPPNLLALLRRH